INIVSVNDQPSGADNTISVVENAAHTFVASDFGFSDPNDTPSNALQAVKIATLPGAGSLTDNGSAITAGQLVSIADINQDKFWFKPAANQPGTGYASFTFQVQDDGGTQFTGFEPINLDPSPNTMTINVSGRAASDFNADVRSDVVWQNDSGQP